MLRVTALELQRKLGEVQEAALIEPVFVIRDGRERLVILSAEEYGRLKRRDRQALRAGELSDADLDAIVKTEVAEEYRHLDTELNDE